MDWEFLDPTKKNIDDDTRNDGTWSACSNRLKMPMEKFQSFTKKDDDVSPWEKHMRDIEKSLTTPAHIVDLASFPEPNNDAKTYRDSPTPMAKNSGEIDASSKSR